MPKPSAGNRYALILERIFQQKYHKGDTEVRFVRSDLVAVAGQLGVELPKNLGDLVYSFRYRAALPESITRHAPKGHEWIIRPVGTARYALVLVRESHFAPNAHLLVTKIPDATPGIVTKYAMSDEQALLARIRYNRLIDIFSGATCYSLQNHLRTTVKGIGQVETDEIYLGLDKQGVHYVFPVQAKGGSDRIGAVQIEQDFAVCAEKFPGAVGRPVAAQFMADGVIALLEFVQTADGVRLVSEKHYQLVAPEQVTDEELKAYRKQSA